MHDEDNEDDTPKGPSLLSRLGSGLLRSPFLTGFLCAFIGLAVLISLLPAHGGGGGSIVLTVHDAPTSVATEAQPRPPSLPEKDVAALKAEPPVTQPAQSEAAPVIADLAILVTDVGLSRRVAEAIDRHLPVETSLAVSVYSSDPEGIARAFKRSDRDIWVHLSCQSLRPGIDPGPLALAAGLPKKENDDLLKKQVEAVGDAAIGVFLPDDADITQKSDLWREIALNAIAHNLMVLDATIAKVPTELYVQKSEAQISAYLKTDITINGDMPPDAFKRTLAEALPRIIKLRQAIVVIRQPSVANVEPLGAWIDTLAAHGVRLVPASKFTGLKP